MQFLKHFNEPEMGNLSLNFGILAPFSWSRLFVRDVCNCAEKEASAIFNSGGCSQRKREVTGDETDCRNAAEIQGSGMLFGGELVLKVRH